MPTPLASRFVHLEIRVDPDHWLNYLPEVGAMFLSGRIVGAYGIQGELVRQSRENRFPIAHRSVLPPLQRPNRRGTPPGSFSGRSFSIS